MDRFIRVPSPKTSHKCKIIAEKDVFSDITQAARKKKIRVLPTVRVVATFMGSGTKGKKWGGIRDHRPRIWNHKPGAGSVVLQGDQG